VTQPAPKKKVAKKAAAEPVDVKESKPADK
jgi:hypothetical protein